MSTNSPASLPPEIGVVLPSGGRGERAGPGGPKQLREIGGVPMLLRALRPFARHPRVDQIVVSLPADLLAEPPPWLAELEGDRVRLVEGGASRAESVRNGVAALRGCAGVLVHDAARPFVSVETIDGVIAAVTRGACAIAAVPVTDTLKRADADGARVLETVDRRALWRAQTPQGFPLDLLLRVYDHSVHEMATTSPTDEATLVERAGIPVEIVCDSSLNMKVTTAEDFRVAEALVSR